jgi:hypothetical protein
MIRVILYFIAFIAILYLLLWLKSKWDKLKPELKKQILYFGLLNLFNFLKLKWQIILAVLWQIVKRLMRK